MMETVNICPVCDGKDFRQKYKARDHVVSGETYTVEECLSCGLLLTNPRPAKDAIGPYYMSENYMPHSPDDGGLIGNLYKMVRVFLLWRKQKVIASNLADKQSSNTTILDIGCGTGEFLNKCKESGWKTVGVEPVADARKHAKDTFGLSVFEEVEQPEVSKQLYDAITLWHVLEHIHDVNEAIENIYKLLKNDGFVLIAVPNSSSSNAKIYGDYWAALDVPRHIYHFNPSSIQKLMEKHGFSLSSIQPMPMDAFYISMLSERYLGTKLGAARAILNGSVSTLSGMLETEKFSSLAYIFRKSDFKHS
ncbi:MAG: class I SAM-dependent methyltransferase [Bacteroidia bacterium]